MQKVLIFIVSYNAERFIESVLSRIPDDVWQAKDYQTHVLIIDDCSKDQTIIKAEEYQRKHNRQNLSILYNTVNQGYGGNQKIGFHYAIQNGFDAVVLLHGDGQYAPELLDSIIRPLVDDKADVVLGSRMVNKQDALKGGMPFYKWVGNQLLTRVRNMILGSELAEFHTGYRAYQVKSLQSVPFKDNSDYFDFDTDILIQMIQTKKRFKEIPIPTFYGQEKCHVNGIKYAMLILIASIRSQMQGFGIWYDPKFDYENSNNHYSAKFGFASSHEFAVRQCQPETVVIDLGCGPGFISEELNKRGIKVISVDRQIQPLAARNSMTTCEIDLDSPDFKIPNKDVKTVLALDIIEHLKSPENFLARLRTSFGDSDARIVLTTANIGFITMRFALLLGSFNYGKRGILDLDHKRLFTFSSLEKLLNAQGFQIEKIEGIPAPFPIALGNNFLSRLLLSINQVLIALFRSLFAYQIAFVVRAKPTLDHLLENAVKGREIKIALHR